MYDQEHEHEDSGILLAIAGAMPWVISLLFHIGIFLILLFMVFISLKKSVSTEITIAGPVFVENAGQKNIRHNVNNRKTNNRKRSRKTKDFSRKETTNTDPSK